MGSVNYKDKSKEFEAWFYDNYNVIFPSFFSKVKEPRSSLDMFVNEYANIAYSVYVTLTTDIVQQEEPPKKEEITRDQATFRLIELLQVENDKGVVLCPWCNGVVSYDHTNGKKINSSCKCCGIKVNEKDIELGGKYYKQDSGHFG